MRAASAIDNYLPEFDVRSAHEIEVGAPASVTYEAMRTMDMGRSFPVAALVAIRGVPHYLTGKARPTRSLTLDGALELGFVVLEENPPHEFVMGSVGKFWRPDSGMVGITPEGLPTFDSPGFTKAVLSFRVEAIGRGRSLFATETRVACTDDASRRKFSIYWRAIGPFSGLIRKLMLDQVKRVAESTPKVA